MNAMDYGILYLTNIPFRANVIRLLAAPVFLLLYMSVLWDRKPWQLPATRISPLEQAEQSSTINGAIIRVSRPGGRIYQTATAHRQSVVSEVELCPGVSMTRHREATLESAAVQERRNGVEGVKSAG
ncbi:hypothetical protein T11_4902 [Trichinella zimbabwensis]|uniref:Uncharacterized protein n=1 Tax=Trichinella zimbabwensis TaxID=268475 RepID=A0A0V1I1E7_9BILA|nr:hypothetical protein T11_4902 [Trichinella zimbabwensis]